MNIKIVLVLVLLTCGILATLAPEAKENSDFEAYKVKHGKTYDEKESRYRLFLYRQAQQQIRSHNSNPQHTWQKGENKFTDLTHEEFSRFYLGAIPPAQAKLSVNSPNEQLSEDSSAQPIVRVAVAKNWTALNKVTPVKDQLSCGSCWAFATTAVIQAAHLIKSNANYSISQQELVDCTYQFGGCDGGWMTDALSYIKFSKGIYLNSAYPYYATNTSCWLPKSTTVVKIVSYAQSASTCVAIQDALMLGPVSGAVMVTNGFGSYSSGVYTETIANPTDINHAITITGLATGTSGLDWIVKNSWGKTWGRYGYITIKSGNNANICSYGCQSVVV